MDLKLLLTLVRPQRIPLYMRSLVYALFTGVFNFKVTFPGMISLPECVTLYKLAKTLKKNSIIVEIGCYGGLSTVCLLAGSCDASTVYSIDPFAKDLNKQRKILEAGVDAGHKHGQIPMLNNKPTKKETEKLLKKNGFDNFVLIEGYSHEVVKKWNKKIDLLWIDGDHEYEAVKKDYLSWSKYLKKGGVIVFDDANKKGRSGYWDMGLPGPTKVVKEYIKKPKWIDIRRVDALVCATKNY